MRFRILGPLEVEREGHVVDLGRRKQRELLAVLLLNANRVVSVDDLVGALWPGTRPADAAAGVQVQVARLRNVLGRAPPAEADRIETRRPGYRLRVTLGEVDVDRFDQLAAQGRHAAAAGRHVEAAERLDAALSLWRGPPLAELNQTKSLRPRIQELEELELTLTEELVEARLALGQHHQLVGHLEVLVAAQPLRERRWAALMLALYRSGRQVEALRAYQEVLALLGREFGLKPQPQLARLEHEVLLQSAALDWHQPPPPAAEAV